MSHPLDDIQDPIDWDELERLDAEAEIQNELADERSAE